MERGKNVVLDSGQSIHRCGYCGGYNGFCSHGMVAKSPMSVDVYQDLLDIGWRRSGTYIYKVDFPLRSSPVKMASLQPDLSRMCCPSYTIRLNVNEFVPCKSHKKSMRKLQSYLDGGALAASYKLKEASPQRPARQETAVQGLWKFAMKEALQRWFSAEGIPKVPLDVVVELPSATQKRKLPETVFLTSPVCLKLFHVLQATHQEHVKWRSPSEVSESFCSFFRELQDTLFEHTCTPKQQDQWKMLMQKISLHPLQGYINFHLCERGSLIEEEAQTLLSFLPAPDVDSSDSRMEVEESAESTDMHPERHRETGSLPIEFCIARPEKRSLTTTLAPSSFIEEEYALYKRYQMRVHGDSPNACSKSQYSRFLVDTPLIHEPASEGKPAMGSFHMQYRIDGRLVAVGVLDILPRSISSKYLFWDPDFAPLSLGRISALKEIELVQEAYISCPSLQYYYMGFYIQSCPKMRYKGAYEPSQLLCPSSYLWVKLTDTARQMLEDNAFVHLGEIPGAETQENVVCTSPEAADMDAQLIRIGGEPMSFRAYVERLQSELPSSNGLFSLLAGGMQDQRQPLLDRIVQLVSKALEEWRALVMNVANQLVYETHDYLAQLA